MAAGKSSVTTYIVDDRLPWPDDAPQPMRGAELDQGAIYDASTRQDCLIRKISARGATIQAELSKSPGDTVAVELVTGQRPSAKVEWVKGGEAGVSFNQPVDLLALINRSLLNQPAERRTMPRVEIRCTAYIRWAGKIEPATMRNISANGLQLEGPELAPRGTFVSTFVDGLVIPPGEVVWRKGDLAGIQFMEEISWTPLVPWIRQAMRGAAK